jgi:hypothetical protein
MDYIIPAITIVALTIIVWTKVKRAVERRRTLDRLYWLCASHRSLTHPEVQKRPNVA